MDIKADDYKSLYHKVVFMNLISQTTVLDPREVIIESLLDAGIVLNVPSNTCMKGHTLMIALFDANKKVKLKKFPKDGNINGAILSVTGKITEVETGQDPDVHSVKVEFQQFDQDLWGEIIAQYEKKQEDVGDLVRKVIG